MYLNYGSKMSTSMYHVPQLWKQDENGKLYSIFSAHVLSLLLESYQWVIHEVDKYRRNYLWRAKNLQKKTLPCLHGT
jgi:hypothetical protein